MELHILGPDRATSFIATGQLGVSVRAPALGMTTPQKWLGLRDVVLERHGVAIANGQPAEVSQSTAASIGTLLRASLACRTVMELDRLKADWLRAPVKEVTDLCIAQTSGQVSPLSYEVTYTFVCREMLPRIPIRIQTSAAAADALNLKVGAGSHWIDTKSGFFGWYWYRNGAGEFAFHGRCFQPSLDIQFMISSFEAGPRSTMPTPCLEEEAHKAMTLLEPFCKEQRLSAHWRLAFSAALRRHLKAAAYS